ncbi:MAG: DUF1566 domain-containing protein [bacterium]
MKKQVALLLVLVTMIIGGFGCESKKDEKVAAATTGETAPAAKTASINVRVNMDSQSSAALYNALGTADQISTITVDATNDTNEAAITSTSLENVDGIWQGTLNELPYNVKIRFTAKAYSAGSVVIFSSTMTQTLVSGADNDLTIALSSVDDGLEPVNPVIVSVSMPQKVLIDSDPQRITVKINHNASVQYTIGVTTGKIAAAFNDVPVSTLSGVHNPASDLEFFYKAPSAPGVAELTITVKDLIASDIIGASYYISIVSFDPDTWTDSGISVIVGPAITGMTFSRSATTLKATVATDPASGLTYAWTGTGGFASLNTTGNPIFITGFTDTLAGSISVMATDVNNLKAFTTRTVLAGDYPYTVQEYIVDMPEIYIYDETTQLLWQDNTNKISQKWASAVSYCQNLNLVNYAGWRLPTKNELVNMFDRRADFSNFYTAEYWSADKDPDDSGKAYTVSYANGGIAVQSLTKKNLVRCVKN